MNIKNSNTTVDEYGYSVVTADVVVDGVETKVKLTQNDDEAYLNVWNVDLNDWRAMEWNDNYVEIMESLQDNL